MTKIWDVDALFANMTKTEPEDQANSAGNIKQNSAQLADDGSKATEASTKSARAAEATTERQDNANVPPSSVPSLLDMDLSNNANNDSNAVPFTARLGQRPFVRRSRFDDAGGNPPPVASPPIQVGALRNNRSASSTNDEESKKEEMFLKKLENRM